MGVILEHILGAACAPDMIRVCEEISALQHLAGEVHSSDSYFPVQRHSMLLHTHRTPRITVHRICLPRWALRRSCGTRGMSRYVYGFTARRRERRSQADFTDLKLNSVDPGLLKAAIGETEVRLMTRSLSLLSLSCALSSPRACRCHNILRDTVRCDVPVAVRRARLVSTAFALSTQLLLATSFRTTIVQRQRPGRRRRPRAGQSSRSSYGSTTGVCAAAVSFLALSLS
jgi:hypothetical protein